MNKGITVKQLLAMCKEQLNKGNGDKYILISDDDEGNGFHTLFYGMDDSREVKEMALMCEHDYHTLDEIVVLG